MLLCLCRQDGPLTRGTDSYGGAILFVSFLAEMRRPWDFWKGLLCAQMFICFVYIFFGAFVSCHSRPLSIMSNGATGVQFLRSIFHLQHLQRRSAEGLANRG